MTSHSISFWDKVELTLLRLLTVFLSLIDGLFRVRWGERLLERMTKRWETQITQLDQALARLEQERSQLHSQAEALSIHAAAIYLGGRSLARNELVFDPANPRDEKVLDASIKLLVKTRLAAIETEEIETGHYLYHLDPDWPAIRSHLAGAAEQADPEIAEWLGEGARFIDEAFLGERNPEKSG